MNFKGLTDREVLESREKYGSNVIPDSEPTTFWAEFKETFGDPMIRLLLVISAIMLGMFAFGYADIYEPIGTFVAILIVAFVTAKTNVASDVKYRALKDRTKKDQCKVYRNGIISVIDNDDVAVGDYILLQPGNKVPADGSLVFGALRVNNSALNGEAEECPKTACGDDFRMPNTITGDTIVDEHSMFRGTVVFDGEGVMRVEKVGLNTMMGTMAGETQNGKEPDSPLKVKLAKLADVISKFGYVAAVVIAILSMWRFISSAGGISAYFASPWPIILKDVCKAASRAVTIVVCAVPEGLPLMISLVLMQNTSKMLDHNVLVRKAQGIETAGSLNILFSDKTGTITFGILQVVELFTGDGIAILLENFHKHGKLKSLIDMCIGKNTQSMFDEKGEVIGGNATDQALIRFIGKDTYDALQTGKALSVTNFQGFNSANKFSQVYLAEQGKTFYKGAPERLLASAKKYLTADGELRDIDFDVINAKIDALANKSMRVLAFGYSEQEMVEDKINSDVVIIGFVGIRDDVRPEARDAIAEVKGAGIQVVMITGDRLETAVAIARDAGLMESSDDVALTSSQLNEMSDSQIKSLLPRIRVIARALPTDKSRMARLAQELNLVAGMTGDGVNDTPALKRADVGFAMGSGTEAAKESSKIVIQDDNFRSIKDAVWYGRTIYHNILKFCKFQLVINVAAVVVSSLAPFLGVEEPLKVTHLLFVNLVMDSFGAIMLGNEIARASYMTEKPRRRDESILSKPMLIQIGFMGLWLTALSFAFLKMPVFDQFFATTEQKLSAYFVLFIWSALFNGFNVRDDGFGIFKGLGENPGFMKVFVTIVLIQAAIVNAALVPGLGFISNMFGCVPFGISGWIVVILLAATMIPVDLLRKTLTNRK